MNCSVFQKTLQIIIPMTIIFITYKNNLSSFFIVCNQFLKMSKHKPEEGPWSDTEEEPNSPKYCKQCDRWFSRVDNAQRHKRTVHSKEARSLLINYRCHYCVSHVKYFSF